MGQCEGGKRKCFWTVIRKGAGFVGQIVKITCTSCKAEWKCQTGCGILHADLARIAELYPPEAGREIREYARQTALPLFDFGYRLSYCASCNSIVGVPVLELEDRGGTYVGLCPQCLQETELIGQTETAECPVCRQRMLKSEVTGLWD